MGNEPTRRWYETRAQYASRLAAWRAAQPKPTLPASLVGLVNPYRSPSERRYQPERTPSPARDDDNFLATSALAALDLTCTSAPDTSSSVDTSSSSDNFSGGGGDFGGGGSDGSW